MLSQGTNEQAKLYIAAKNNKVTEFNEIIKEVTRLSVLEYLVGRETTKTRDPLFYLNIMLLWVS